MLLHASQDLGSSVLRTKGFVGDLSTICPAVQWCSYPFVEAYNTSVFHSLLCTEDSFTLQTLWVFKGMLQIVIYSTLCLSKLTRRLFLLKHKLGYFCSFIEFPYNLNFNTSKSTKIHKVIHIKLWMEWFVSCMDLKKKYISWVSLKIS